MRPGFSGALGREPDDERTVDHVKQQLVVGRPTVSGCLVPCGFGAGDDLSVEMSCGTFQNEAQHVGGVVVVQVATVQFTDCLIVDQRNTDLGLLDPCALQNLLHGKPESLPVDREDGLLVGDVDHELAISGQRDNRSSWSAGCRPRL